MPRLTRIFLLVLLLIAMPAFARPAAEPDPSANPVLATIIKSGAKLYYLGTRDGMDGWFILKDGQVQIAYAQPKSQQALLGVLFGPDGENITANQVQAFLNTHKEVSDMLTAGLAATAALVPPAAAGGLPTAPAAAALASPGERLMGDLQAAAGITIGNPSAPLLMMVMDPDCPHCKATWRMLRDKVIGGQLQVRMVPIVTRPDEERQRNAAMMLHLADPLNAWDKWVAGDKSQLAGTPSPDLLNAIETNNRLIDSWHIQATPFLVYRGKDGTVKIIQGEPENPTALLADIIP